jgi:hypothetical protein
MERKGGRSRSRGASLDGAQQDGEVVVRLDPDCIHGENIGEFHPEAIEAATAMLRGLLDDSESRAHRDAGVLAACVVSVALQQLVRAALNQSEGA